MNDDENSVVDDWGVLVDADDAEGEEWTLCALSVALLMVEAEPNLRLLLTIHGQPYWRARQIYDAVVALPVDRQDRGEDGEASCDLSADEEGRR